MAISKSQGSLLGSLSWSSEKAEPSNRVWGPDSLGRKKGRKCLLTSRSSKCLLLQEAFLIPPLSSLLLLSQYSLGFCMFLPHPNFSYPSVKAQSLISSFFKIFLMWAIFKVFIDIDAIWLLFYALGLGTLRHVGSQLPKD